MLHLILSILLIWLVLSVVLTPALLWLAASNAASGRGDAPRSSVTIYPDFIAR